MEDTELEGLSPFSLSSRTAFKDGKSAVISMKFKYLIHGNNKWNKSMQNKQSCKCQLINPVFNERNPSTAKSQMLAYHVDQVCHSPMQQAPATPIKIESI